MKARHPRTGIFGKAAFAGLALVVLRALVEPHVPTVQAKAHTVVQKIDVRDMRLRSCHRAIDI